MSWRYEEYRNEQGRVIYKSYSRSFGNLELIVFMKEENFAQRWRACSPLLFDVYLGNSFTPARAIERGLELFCEEIEKVRSDLAEIKQKELV